jgi:muramidase (phage lysozyme)
MVTVIAKMTPLDDDKPVIIKIDPKQLRREQNEKYLENKNVKAFLDTLAWTEGGDYDYLFGATPNGKKWRFTNFSTHPGPGSDGVTTAAGRYQITKATWSDFGVKALGLRDFSKNTQDLIAIELLRKNNAIDGLVDGHLDKVVSQAALRWQSLPMGPGLANRPNRDGTPSKQPYKKYDDVAATYKAFGGALTK